MAMTDDSWLKPMDDRIAELRAATARIREDVARIRKTYNQKPMSKYTKLQIMVGEALDYAPDSPKVTAAVEAMADWFDILLENMGIQPSAIPALLRWQVLQGELLEGGND
jgi:hypothetical protein